MTPAARFAGPLGTEVPFDPDLPAQELRVSDETSRATGIPSDDECRQHVAGCTPDQRDMQRQGWWFHYARQTNAFLKSIGASTENPFAAGTYWGEQFENHVASMVGGGEDEDAARRFARIVVLDDSAGLRTDDDELWSDADWDAVEARFERNLERSSRETPSALDCVSEDRQVISATRAAYRQVRSWLRAGYITIGRTGKNAADSTAAIRRIDTTFIRELKSYGNASLRGRALDLDDLSPPGIEVHETVAPMRAGPISR